MRAPPSPPGSGGGLNHAGHEDDRCTPHSRAESCAFARAAEEADRHLGRADPNAGGAVCHTVRARLQAQLVADPAQQIRRVDAELLELVAMLLRVDPIRQLLLGPLDLVVGAAVAQHLKDLLLRNLHGCSLGVGWDARSHGWAAGGGPAYSGSGRSSPGQAPVSRAKPWREPWSARPRTSRKIAPSTTNAASSFTKPPDSRCCGCGGSSLSIRPQTCSKILRPTMPATRPRARLNGVKTSFMRCPSSCACRAARGTAPCPAGACRPGSAARARAPR